MSTYASFAAVLDEPAGVDRWEDHLLDEAVTLLRRFTDPDWQHLRLDIPHRPSAWRTRCAQTACDGDPARAVPLLLDLLQDGSPDVAEAAADSLHSVLQDGVAVALDDDSRAALRRLGARGGLAAVVVARVLAGAAGP